MLEKFLKSQYWFLFLSIFFFVLPAKYIDIPFYFAVLIFLIKTIRKEIHFSHEGKMYFMAWIVWALMVGIASLFSPDRAIAFHKWPNHFLWIIMPFVVMVTSKADEKWLKRYLYGFITLASALACIMVYQGAILHIERAGQIFSYNIGICTQVVLIASVVVETIFLDKRILFKWRNLLGILWLVMIMGVIYTRTRSAWIAGGIAWSIIFLQYIFKDKRNLKFLAIVVCMLVGSVLVNPSLLARWNSPDVIRGSNIPRIHLWIAGWNMFKDHPIVGVGYDCFDKNFHGEYKWDGMTKEEASLRSAHNQFVEAISETGVIGLFGYVFFLVSLFGHSWKQYKKYDDPYSLMIFGISMTLLIVGMTGVVSGSSHVLRNYWLMMGTLVLCSKKWKEQKLLEQKSEN